MLGGLASALPAPAQPVFGSPPTAELVPASMRQIKGKASPARSRGPDQTSPFVWGPFSLHPFVSERFIYSDGLLSGPGRPTNSYVSTLSPGIQFDLGQYWTVNYAATWNVYTSKLFKESLDHAVNVAGMMPLNTWTANFSQGYSTSTQPLIETGRQTGQENVTTSLGLSKVLGRKVTLHGSISQNLSFITSAPDSYTWGTDLSLGYQVSSKTNIGIGCGAGYVDQDPGVNMAYVRPNARIAWIPTERLNFSAMVGENIQQVYSRGVSAMFTPVFDVSGTYKPFQNTSMSLTAGRTVSPSVLRNQVNDSTTWSTSFSQRLLKRFNFTGNYGETDSGYSATNERVTAGRRDKSYNYGLRLGTTFLKRGTIGLLYQVTHNASNSTGFSFNSTQTGVELGFRY